MGQRIKRVIYCFWTGDNPITPNRIIGLHSMQNNFGVDIDFIDSLELNRRIGIGNLHPAYNYLSNNHKSDYLRCYFMHHFGGGYSDIKIFSSQNNWKQQFDLINEDENIQIIGEQEISGGSPIERFNYSPFLEKMLVNGWFICRPKSEFTTEWYNRVCKVLDSRMDDLIKYPATEPFGGKNYKIRWAEIQGEVFHQLIYDRYDNQKIRNSLISGRTWYPYR